MSYPHPPRFDRDDRFPDDQVANTRGIMLRVEHRVSGEFRSQYFIYLDWGLATPDEQGFIHTHMTAGVGEIIQIQPCLGNNPPFTDLITTEPTYDEYNGPWSAYQEIFGWTVDNRSGAVADPNATPPTFKPAPMSGTFTREEKRYNVAARYRDRNGAIGNSGSDYSLYYVDAVITPEVPAPPEEPAPEPAPAYAPLRTGAARGPSRPPVRQRAVRDR